MEPPIKSLIKGTVSRDGNFFEVLNILISTFCVCANGFQGLSKIFHYPIQLVIFRRIPNFLTKSQLYLLG
jgi:hypothetical protein